MALNMLQYSKQCGDYFFGEKQNFEQDAVFTAPVYYSSTRLLPSPNVSKICAFRAKMTSKVIWLIWMCFKKNNLNKNQTSIISSKMLFYLFIFLCRTMLFAFFKDPFCLLKSGETPNFLLASTSPFPFLLLANTSAPALLLVKVFSLHSECLFTSLCSSFIF